MGKKSKGGNKKKKPSNKDPEAAPKDNAPPTVVEQTPPSADDSPSVNVETKTSTTNDAGPSDGDKSDGVVGEGVAKGNDDANPKVEDEAAAAKKSEQEAAVAKKAEEAAAAAAVVKKADEEAAAAAAKKAEEEAAVAKKAEEVAAKNPTKRQLIHSFDMTTSTSIISNEKEGASTTLRSTNTPNYSCGCACDVCYCGPNCQCTETLCRCEASSVLNSLSRSISVVSNTTGITTSTTPVRGGSSCCANKSTRGQPKKQVSFQEDAAEASPSDDDRKRAGGNHHSLSTLEVGIVGMTCSMCSKAITQALQGMEGVSTATVSLATDTATILYDPSQLTPQDLYSAIDDIGYEVVTMMTPTASNPSSTAVVEFSVRGMTCSMCTQAIQRALEAAPGVETVSVSLSTNLATVQFISDSTTMEELREAIEDIGYEVAEAILLDNDDGEQEVLSGDRLERLLQQQRRQVASQKRAFLWSLAGTCPILVMTMILPHISSDSGLERFLHQEIVIGNTKIVLEALILWILCTPIQFGSGWSFYKMSYYNLQQGVMGMDVLVAVGTSASYGYAVWATLAGSMEYHFFETSAVLICFVLLGKWMQRLAVRRTSQALTQLLALQPKTAIKVISPAGADENTNWNPLEDSYQELVVPVQAVKEGDLVKILKGASIPADGRVTFGEMSVDESMITGESIPVLKTKGSIVLGGTICAEAGQAAGASFVQVTGVGSATALSQIVKLVQDAQNRQVPIQNLADTIAGIFVPVVVTFSVLTYMIWYAAIQSGIVPLSYLPEDESPATFSLLFGIACLVISCPCALGLATPTAVMVGTGVGAQQGILMKGGETLELASKVDSVVFDKTGTLTKGKPAITDFTILVTDAFFWNEVLQLANPPKGRTSRQHLLWLLGSLERNSEHPLASAVVYYAQRDLLESIPFVQPTDFVALTGRGASGTIAGTTKLAVGNRAFCAINDIPIDHAAEDAMQRMERQGKTAIVAAVNGNICVVMGIADELKPDAAAAISYLQEKMGVDVWMVTGDNRRTARAIARQLRLPMDRVIAEALPVAKVQKVQELQESGRIVAMIGDGVNDSPALAQANVGLSLGTGAEIAAEASDMVLVKGNVADVCTALDLSQVIFRRIKVCL
jgi:Cu+-exporting ATPase